MIDGRGSPPAPGIATWRTAFGRASLDTPACVVTTTVCAPAPLATPGESVGSKSEPITNESVVDDETVNPLEVELD